MIAAGAAPAQDAPPAPPVSVAEVVVRDIADWDDFNARIEASEVVQVRPRVGGVVEKVAYREGTLVNAGDLLFVLDKRSYRAELVRAEAELARARAQAKLANVETKRARNLLEQKLVSQGEYDQRVATEDEANANVRAAQATVDLTRLNLEYTEVRAPISGRSGRALITKGNLVVSDPTPDTLTTIVKVDPVYVVFSSDEATYLKYLRLNDPETQENRTAVLVGVGNGPDYPLRGNLDFIDNRLDPATGTIRMRAVLRNEDHLLTPGLFARARLLAGEPSTTVLIDEQAILTDQDRKYVYVLGPENRALRRDIKPGRQFEGLRVIREGLQEGEQVIVYGLQRIFFPGMQVAPQVINMGDPPPAPGGPPGHAP
jgi:multidrug efflux system membrane fusion protein